MAEKRWDAIVVGTGPAGASAARTLVAGGMECLLIEKRKLPRNKMCSGILSDWSVDFVHQKFGAMPRKIYGEPNFYNAVTLHFPSLPDPVVIPSKGPIPNVWRSHFDNFLARASGARIRDRLDLENIEPLGNGYKVICKRLQTGKPPGTLSFKTRYVVAADGANSRSLRRMMPETFRGVPFGTGMQLHYRGEVNLDPHQYHVFFYPDMGFYAWASIKTDDIHVGVGGVGKRSLLPYHANFVSLLEKDYGLKIQETILREGMAGVIRAPLNSFVLGKGNFLAAGDAAGFLHTGGEGISCALTTGDLAGEAILTAERNGLPAVDVYRKIVKKEAELCLDQFNLLRMIQTSPMRMDFKAIWRNHSLKELHGMWKDLKGFVAQDNGFSTIGIGKVARQNMLHYLRHGNYPISL